METELLLENGNTYIGRVANDRPNGEGREYREHMGNLHLCYEGEWEDGKRHGSGRLCDENG